MEQVMLTGFIWLLFGRACAVKKLSCIRYLGDGAFLTQQLLYLYSSLNTV